MSKHQGPDELSEALALEKKRRSEERLLKQRTSRSKF